MRRDHVDALGDRQPRRVGIDHEGREAFARRAFAGAGEHDVMVRDAAVGDPGLVAVDAHMRVAVGRRGRRHRGDVGAGLRLGQREGRDCPAVAHGRQIALPSAPACRTARSRRCRAPAWRRRNPRGRRETPEFRARGRACARRAFGCSPPYSAGTPALRNPACAERRDHARGRPHPRRHAASAGRVASAQRASSSAKRR